MDPESGRVTILVLSLESVLGRNGSSGRTRGLVSVLGVAGMDDARLERADRRVCPALQESFGKRKLREYVTHQSNVVVVLVIE